MEWQFFRLLERRLYRTEDHLAPATKFPAIELSLFIDLPHTQLGLRSSLMEDAYALGFRRIRITPNIERYESCRVQRGYKHCDGPLDETVCHIKGATVLILPECVSRLHSLTEREINHKLVRLPMF